MPYLGCPDTWTLAPNFVASNCSSSASSFLVFLVKNKLLKVDASSGLVCAIESIKALLPFFFVVVGSPISGTTSLSSPGGNPNSFPVSTGEGGNLPALLFSNVWDTPVIPPAVTNPARAPAAPASTTPSSQGLPVAKFCAICSCIDCGSSSKVDSANALLVASTKAFLASGNDFLPVTIATSGSIIFNFSATLPPKAPCNPVRTPLAMVIASCFGDRNSPSGLIWFAMAAAPAAPSDIPARFKAPNLGKNLGRMVRPIASSAPIAEGKDSSANAAIASGRLTYSLPAAYNPGNKLLSFAASVAAWLASSILARNSGVCREVKYWSISSSVGGVGIPKSL